MPAMVREVYMARKANFDLESYYREGKALRAWGKPDGCEFEVAWSAVMCGLFNKHFLLGKKLISFSSCPSGWFSKF